jgi:hypothetical protein
MLMCGLLAWVEADCLTALRSARRIGFTPPQPARPEGAQWTSHAGAGLVPDITPAATDTCP